MLWIDIEQIQFDMSLRTKKDLLAAIGSLTNIVFFKFIGKADQRFSDIQQISLWKMMFSQFFLLYRLFQGEVVVCHIGVQHLMFDA